MSNLGGEKVRLDAALVMRGAMPTRARAQAVILAGEVYVDGVRVTKAGTRVSPDATIEVRSRRPPFVSRGGEKLAHALRAFGIDVTGLRAADVGASTGGFTDCLLQRGARRVYAIDVGTGQLAWRLRGDSRVVSLERRDIRTVTPDDLEGPVDLAAIDVAFIALAKVLPAVAQLQRPGGTVVALVKPQFEAGPKAAHRGVVRDPLVHEEVVARVMQEAEDAGFAVVDATASPLAGPEGNLEYFLHLRNAPGPRAAIDIKTMVATAHATIRRRGARTRPVPAGAVRR